MNREPPARHGEWMVVSVLLAPALLLGLAVWAAWNLSDRDNVSPSGSAVVPATAASGRQIPAPRDGAEKLARERLARGEIDVEDYERIISVLRG
jgi:hypothetical protein